MTLLSVFDFSVSIDIEDYLKKMVENRLSLVCTKFSQIGILWDRTRYFKYGGRVYVD